MPFNEILAQERRSQGLSQEELASRIQVSRQAVSKWETGDALPDLNKLLALADALNLSLDVLCGREAPPASPGVPSVSKKRSVSLPVIFCVLLTALLALMLLQPQSQPPSSGDPPAAETAVQLPEDFGVSGVAFHPNSDYRVDFQFTPDISGEGFTYQITFLDQDGISSTFDALCSGGVCSGTAAFDRAYGTYTVTVSVSCGALSRNLAIASDLTFRQGSTHFLPLTE